MKRLPLIFVTDRQSTRCVGREATTHRALHVDHVVVTVAAADVALKLLRGSAVNDIDRTTGGVAPVKRALRPLQDFDALHIKHAGIEHRR